MRRRIVLPTLLPLMLATLAPGCAFAPRQGGGPPGAAGWSDGREGIGPLLTALEARDHRALYDGTLAVLDRCGTRPLGQQALLLLAAGELDPRNARGRPAVAREATEIVLRGVEPGSWSGALAASLHLVALRLGADKGGLYAEAERELRSRAGIGSERDAAGARSPCRAAPWAEAMVGGEPPSMRGRSYPELVIELQHRVAELEAELERLRRITREP